MRLFGKIRERWEVVADLEREAFDKWRNDHFPGETMEDAKALGITTIRTTVEATPNGKVLVTVSFTSQRPGKSDEYVFVLQRTGKRHYVVGQST